MPIPQEPQLPLRHNLELPSESELGIFADFANIWHTPVTFVLDFLSLKTPATVEVDEEGQTQAVLNSKVGARVRIPPEQIFPLIEALQIQSQEWLNETGRSVPPDTWLKNAQPTDGEDTVDFVLDDEVPSAGANGEEESQS